MPLRSIANIEFRVQLGQASIDNPNLPVNFYMSLLYQWQNHGNGLLCSFLAVAAKKKRRAVVGGLNDEYSISLIHLLYIIYIIQQIIYKRKECLMHPSPAALKVI